MTFEYGYLWNSTLSELTDGGSGTPMPWSDDFAESVFLGEHVIAGLVNMTVLKRVDGVPVAVAAFQNAGHSVSVEFLDAELRTELAYTFTDHAPETVLSPDGVQRPDDLFLWNVTSFGYSGELDRYRDPVKSRQIQRGYANTGKTGVNLDIEDPEQPYMGVRSEVLDVSGDGFWEPVATFGDWDRWFVKDRPGVKLFD